MTPEQTKHLEFVQAAIQRLAGHSFTVKGWSVALAAAGMAFGASLSLGRDLLLLCGPIVVLFFLDAGYLAYEKQFRALYNRAVGEIRAGTSQHVLDMDASEALAFVDALKEAVKSPSVGLLHGATFLALMLAGLLT